MSDLNHNGIVDAEEAAAYKMQAANSKFAQQLSYGIGAAMVFGLFNVLGGVLADMAGESIATIVGAHTIPAVLAAAGGPILGLVALGVVGVGLLYISAKFLSENTLRDQAMQAKQINVVTRGHAPAVEPIVEMKPQQFPDVVAEAKTDTPKIDEAKLAAVPTTQITHAVHADTITPRVEEKGTKVTSDADAAWANSIAREHASQQQVRA